MLNLLTVGAFIVVIGSVFHSWMVRGVKAVFIGVDPRCDEVVTPFMVTACLDGGIILTSRLYEVGWYLDLDLFVVNLIHH